MHPEWTRCYYCHVQVFLSNLHKRCHICGQDPKGPPPQAPLSPEAREKLAR